MKHTRRLMTAIPAALLGITLAATTAACQPPNRTGDSTAEVCADLHHDLPPLVSKIVASASELDTYPDGPTPVEQSQIVEATRNGYHNLASALRSHAYRAEDENLAATMAHTADGVEARAAVVTTIDEVSKIKSSNAVDLSPLYSYCPGLVLDQKSG